ncbi:MAG: GNAT family N-acetyltransferase [Acidobacteriota bacterium]|nr:GNAT family N-acetyltransferase [Acidobacteriota bacterium]
MVTIRQIQEADAALFLELCHRLDKETQFMMLEPGERKTSLEEQSQQIRNILLMDNQTILVAEAGNEIIGYVAALGGDFRRNRHCAQIVIGVLQVFSGQGVGTKLFLGLEHWARQNSIHRLELTVMAHNDRAVKLYRKMGYEIEGTKRDSLLVNGSYVDEYYMGKLLA